MQKKWRNKQIRKRNASKFVCLGFFVFFLYFVFLWEIKSDIWSHSDFYTQQFCRTAGRDRTSSTPGWHIQSQPLHLRCIFCSLWIFISMSTLVKLAAGQFYFSSLDNQVKFCDILHSHLISCGCMCLDECLSERTCCMWQWHYVINHV